MLATEPQWGTVDQAATLLGVSTKTIRRRIADGSVDARRFGPRLIRVDLNRLIDSGRPLAYFGNAA
jgi:excisionase family DNA binding protein